MNENDIEELELLNIELLSAILFIAGDVLFYIATTEGIEEIYSDYIGEEYDINPDIAIIQSEIFYLIARGLLTYVAIKRYNSLYEQYANGEIEFSLVPDVQFIIGNIFGFIGYYYEFLAAIGIYERNINEPVFE